MISMQKFLVPLAIIASLVILAVAIFLVRGPGPAGQATLNADLIPAVSTEDHIVGSITAPVTVIEYSDIDCPYCKIFEENMKQIMAEYGAAGKVAWVFRHLPLTQLHLNAARHAEATECVASLSNNDGFWKFLDAMHVAAPNSKQFDPAGYAALLPPLGVSEEKFNACLDAGTFKDRVAKHSADAQAAGATGTPFVVFVAPDGTRLPVAGALSYEQLKEVIDSLVGLIPAA